MSVNSKSSSSNTNTKEQEQRLSNHEIQVLYELRGIFNTVESINRSITDAIQLISPGGGLYDAQKRANTGLDDFKKLIEAPKASKK